MEKNTGLIHCIPEWKCVDDQPDNNRRLHYSRFALSPLLVDQAMTIGVAIRRALLSEVEGISIFSANIVGALHEYSTLDGVRESVDEILLNLKQIVLKGAEGSSKTPMGQKEYRASIFAQGPGVVTAEHIKFPSSILAVDPDQPIATLLNETQLCIELFIKQGRPKGALNHTKRNHPGFFIDAKASGPVQKANFSIHSVGDPKGLQQILLLEIWTNKTLTPTEALYQAHASLLNLFYKISPPLPSPEPEPEGNPKGGVHPQGSPRTGTPVGFPSGDGSLWEAKGGAAPKELPTSKNILNQNADSDSRGKPSRFARPFGRLISLETRTDQREVQTNVASDPKELQPSVRLKSNTNTNMLLDKEINDTLNKESLSIDELELSPRISNCLKRANIHTIGDLLSYTQEDLLKIKNFGRKSVEQVSLVLRKRFNMNMGRFTAN